MMSPYTPPASAPLESIYCDEHLLIVNKPSGLLSVPGRGPEKTDCLISRVQAQYVSALIVHRLDMETSGLIILALSVTAQRTMSMMFERRAIEKTYIALIAGNPQTDEGRVELPLSKDWPNRPLQMVDMEGGKPSQTDWQVIERSGQYTRVRLKPVTGRTHQLRVHMDAMGHPILGDTLYGHAESRSGADKLALHASVLKFAHPVKDTVLEVRSEPDF